MHFIFATSVNLAMNLCRQVSRLLSIINSISLRLLPATIFVVLAIENLGANAERLPIKNFSTVDGLAHNNVDRIVRDSRGFLWFCTSGGLSRFDGYSFTNYGTDQGLPWREVADFLETREGEYWVATNAGLVRFDPKTRPQNGVAYATEASVGSKAMFTVVLPEGGDSAAKSITVLLEDHNGTIWCGTRNGLYQLDRPEGHLVLRRISIPLPEADSEGRSVSDLLEDRSGSLWVATPRALDRLWPDGSSGRYTKRDGLPDDYLHDLFKDHDGHLWAGTRYGGFFQFAADVTHSPPVVVSAYSTRAGMPSPWVFQLFETSDRRFWIASNTGLVEFFPNRDDRGRWFHPYSERNGLNYFDITAINEDMGGNLWLGTNSAGTMRLEHDGFVTYAERDGLYSVKSIFMDQAGGICFRGSVLGDKHTSIFEGAELDPLGRAKDYHHTRLGRFDGQRFTWFMPHAIHDLGWIMEGQTLQCRNGEWWVGCGLGICRFPPTHQFDEIKTARPLAVYTRKNGPLHGQPWRLFEDSRGNVWISEMSSTPLLIWERTRQEFRDLSSAPGYPSGDYMPRSFGEDHAGNVWIGFNGQLARYRNGRFTLFGASDGLPPGVIASIYMDHAGRLWLASSRSGLIRVDQPEAEIPIFVDYTTAQGLSSNSTEVPSDQLITEDLQGHIYIGTARGLDRLDPATGDLRHFTTADGLASGAFKASFRDNHGGLWFGMSLGLTHFLPLSYESPQAPPPILISDLHVAGQSQFVSALGENEIHLPDLAVDQSQLQIDFIGLSFAPGVLLNYQYKLEGADADWGAPTPQRSVNYARLAPGRYRFLVRAVNSDGVFSSDPAVITFRILPPFWSRWWFLTLVAIGLTFVFYALYRYRVARLVELERVRTRIATDLHDDIGSSLARMAILSEVAKRRVEDSANESVSILTEIAESARGVVASMSDIVWAIDPRRDDLGNVVFRVRQFASDLLGAQGIIWNLQAPEEFDKIRLNPQQRRQIFLIFKEAINNAARHADCNSVWLSLTVVQNQIIAEIRDDGHGFNVPPFPQVHGNGHGGHGLENIRTRAAQLGGNLSIDSSPNRGTRLVVAVPLKSAMA